MLRFRWFVVLAAAIVWGGGTAVPVAQAVPKTGDDCVYIDGNGQVYKAPCSANEVVTSDIPDPPKPSCVPVPGIPCPKK